MLRSSWIGLGVVVLVLAFAVFQAISDGGGLGTYRYRGNPAMGQVGRFVTAYGQGDAGEYMTLEAPVGTDYQVPEGRTFTISRALFRTDTAGAHYSLGYADTGVAQGSGAPLAVVWLIGTGDRSALAGTGDVDLYGQIPAGKFPLARFGGAGSAIQIWGIEED